MLFKRRPIEEVENTLLVHRIKSGDHRLKKGQLLSAADVAVLKTQAVESVYVATLEEGDVLENIAAETLAKSIAGEATEVDRASAGRCNLRATKAGLLVFNQQGIEGINLVYESLTVATLAPHTVVGPGQIIAKIKIIPFAVRKQHLDECIKIANNFNPVAQIKASHEKQISLIQSSSVDTATSTLDKTARVTIKRIEKLNSYFMEEMRCGHDENEIAEAITQCIQARSDIILVIGASTIVDRGDVIPSAIENIGGEIIHFGMPVEPGNMLLLAKRGKHHIIGLPGCARSAKRNGLDLVMERLVTNTPVTARDIMQMGLGGLLG